MTTTLYVAISSHGFGHIAQTAPVVNELYRREPALRVVIECGAPRDLLAQRFDMPFEHVPVSTDFGMAMKNALEVDVAASHARYVELHAHLEAEVEASRSRLVSHRADVLLGNIPYVPLMAAKRLGLPSVAMCSLNWAAIYGSLCRGMTGSERIRDEMAAGYRGADCFLAPEPSMAMPGLPALKSVGPIARTASCGHAHGETAAAPGRRVVVTMGGIDTPLDFDRWPRVAGVTWVVPDAARVGRDDMMRHSDLAMPFIDLLATSDALVTKPGYGAFVEAACNGVPVLYVPRVDWPEAPHLVRWLQAHANCVEISWTALHTDALAAALEALWSQPRRARVVPTGVAQAADELQRLLCAGDGRRAVEVAG